MSVNSLFDMSFSLILVAKISLICTGVFVSFLEGNILFQFGNKIQDKINNHFILKPLFTCLPCMASVWSIIITMTINIPLILCVCGLNAIIDSIISFIQNQQLNERE